MTVNKILTALLICLGLLKITYSQVSSASVLVDEFETIPCNEFWARLDAFFIALEKDSLSKGYIVIYGKNNGLLANLKYEGWTNGIVNFRRYDKNRIVVVRGTLGEQRKIQFWKVSSGQEEPKFNREDWSYQLPASTKPFIFAHYRWIDILCPSSPSPLKNYADLILANPTARGHLVIRARTKKLMRETEKEVLDELINSYRLPRNRLKLFYVNEKDYRSEETDVEFWFVP